MPVKKAAAKDPEWSGEGESSSDDSIGERSPKKSRKNEKRAAGKRKEDAESRRRELAVDKASVKTYFEYLDAEKTGVLTKNDIVRTAKALHVEFDKGQLDNMLSFVKQICGTDCALDLAAFEKIIVEMTQSEVKDT